MARKLIWDPINFARPWIFGFSFNSSYNFYYLVTSGGLSGYSSVFSALHTT